jgi:hypothetical protein
MSSCTNDSTARRRCWYRERGPCGKVFTNEERDRCWGMPTPALRQRDCFRHVANIVRQKRSLNVCGACDQAKGCGCLWHNAVLQQAFGHKSDFLLPGLREFKGRKLRSRHLHPSPQSSLRVLKELLSLNPALMFRSLRNSEKISREGLQNEKRRHEAFRAPHSPTPYLLVFLQFA